MIVLFCSFSWHYYYSKMWKVIIIAVFWTVLFSTVIFSPHFAFPEWKTQVKRTTSSPSSGRTTVTSRNWSRQWWSSWEVWWMECPSIPRVVHMNSKHWAGFDNVTYKLLYFLLWPFFRNPITRCKVTTLKVLWYILTASSMSSAKIFTTVG